MKATIIALAITLIAISADARGGSSSSGFSGGYSGHRCGHHSGHYRHSGYYGVGDRTPSGYYGRQPGLANIDTRHETAPPTRGMTGNQYYKGRDRHGALVYSNLP